MAETIHDVLNAIRGSATPRRGNGEHSDRLVNMGEIHTTFSLSTTSFLTTGLIVSTTARREQNVENAVANPVPWTERAGSE